MSIEEIKDINKLKQMLKSEIEENKYLKECCIKAGEEFAKNSFEWDGKEKNLVVQAMELNDRYEKLKAENEHLAEKEQEAKHYLEEAEKFKNCLTEIKEIAEANKNYKFKITEGVCIGDTVELKFDVLEQILNKISEVFD